MEENSARPEWDTISSKTSTYKTLWRQWDQLEVKQGVLYRKYLKDETTCQYQIIVPKSMRHDVLHNYHDIPTAAHLGTAKMQGRIQQAFYWPTMKDDIKQYCRSCDKCSARKTAKTIRAPLGQYLVGEPMERIAIDILGPLPKTELGNKFILVMCDCFTKWTEAIPIPDQETNTVIKAFVNEFVCRFGTSLQLHSDQGSNFESKAFKQMCSFLKIDKTRTTSMRPQCNGNVERFNRTLTTMLTMYCEKNQKHWDEILPQVMI